MNLPVYKRSSISAKLRSTLDDRLKFVFMRCPNCSNYSLKPNINLDHIHNAAAVYAAVDVYGRLCSICAYTWRPLNHN